MDRTKAKETLTGPIPTLRTPFTRDGEIDFNALRRMIDFDIEAGAQSIILTAGDSHYEALSDSEIGEVTRATVAQVGGRRPVVAADRSFRTKQALSFAEECREMGVDVLMVKPPDWAKSCTPSTLADHYEVISREIPVMLVTNVFVPRGSAFGMETINRTLEASERVVAIKDDMCGFFAQRLAADFSETCAIWSGGRKQNHMNMAPFGAQGYLSTFLTFKPEISYKYWEAWQKRQLAEATEIIRNIDIPFFDFISGLEGGFDAGMHGTLEVFGLAERWRPAPYASLSDQELERLKTFFQEKELL